MTGGGEGVRWWRLPGGNINGGCQAVAAMGCLIVVATAMKVV